MFRRIFDFFIFSSAYIACCAVLMVWQTTHLLLGTPPPLYLAGFVFFSTICSYNFHWYLTPQSVNSSRRISWTQRHKTLHGILYLAGAIGSLICFGYLLPHLIAIAFGAFLTFLYSAPKLPQPVFHRLRHIAIGKTLFLAFVWTYVTAVLPILINHGQWNGDTVLYVTSRFFLIYAICIVFDFRDREDDKADGIRSLITLLDERGIDILFTICLLAFAGTTIGLYAWRYPAFYILLLLIPGLILAALYGPAKKNFSDNLYYFVLDGLMMFSGLLMLVFRI